MEVTSPHPKESQEWGGENPRKKRKKTSITDIVESKSSNRARNKKQE